MGSNTSVTQTLTEPEAVFDSAKAGIRPLSIKLHNATPALDTLASPSWTEKKDEIDKAPGTTTTPAAGKDEITNRPKGLSFVLLYTCILLGNFLVGYDNSCVAVLGPSITDDFNALTNLGWYAIAYLLAMSATLLIYGKLYSYYSMKNIYIASFCVFVIGSIITASAPTSPTFIVGRALSGLGSAGIFSGSTIIVANTTSLKHRPIYIAICGSTECIALAVGPIIAGALAHFATWRVCFWICVPLGIIIIAAVFVCVSELRRPENAHLSSKEKRERLDLTGIVISVPMTLCLVLGLQWAGTAYSWDDWRIVLLLVFAGVLLLTFIFVEYRGGDHSMISLTMMRQRSVALSSIITFCNVGALSVIAYYIALYFQAVRGATTLTSAIMYLPMAGSMAIAALAGGHITSFIGYSNPNLILGSVLEVIGAALLTTLEPKTPAPKWIGYQVLYGIGVGLAFQPPYVAVQAALPDSLVPMALVTLAFTQIAGGIIILSIAQNVFFTRLSHNLAAAVPSLESSAILHNGALNIIRTVPVQYLEDALHAYNEAIVNVFYIAVGLSCLIAVSSLCMQWKSVKGAKRGEANDV